VLKDHRVPEDHVMLINLFCTPSAARRIVAQEPILQISFSAEKIFDKFFFLLKLWTKFHPESKDINFTLACARIREIGNED
jgi:hypothetical protein